MINKNNYSKIDWSNYNPKQETFIGSTQYFEREIQVEKLIILNTNLENVSIDRGVECTDL